MEAVSCLSDFRILYEDEQNRTEGVRTETLRPVRLRPLRVITLHYVWNEIGDF
jgi:hypothetical protein